MGIFDDDTLEDQASELRRVIGDPSVSKEMRDMARSIERMETRVRQAGIDPELTEPRGSLLWDVLDTLDAPRQGLAGIVDAAVRGDMFTDDVGTGFRRGQMEDITTSDILGRAGMDAGIGREVLGFAGDVLSDPLGWVTFGAGTAAKAGGRVLTEGGQQLSKNLSERLIAGGLTDPTEHGELIDTVFKAAGRYKDEAKKLEKFDSPAARDLALNNMSKAEEVLTKAGVNLDEIAGDIFESNKLRVGMNVPFLGHLTGESNSVKEVITQDIGPVGQALRAAGRILNPGKVKVAELELSDELVDAFDNVRLFANEKVAEIAAMVEPIPVAGLVVKGARKAVDVTKSATEGFKKIFAQKAITGANANNNRLDFLNVKAANKLKAMDRVMEVFSPEELTNKALMKDIALELDAMAMVAAKQTIQDGDIVNVFNRVAQSDEVLDGDLLAIGDALRAGGTEDVFRVQLDNYLQNPNVPPEKKDLMGRVIGAMDELAITEQEKGLGYQFLEYYLPHRYKNLNAVKGASAPGKADSFTKGRTFSSIGEAFEQRALVGDTDLPDLLRWRYQKGYDMLAQRQYAQRLMLEEGLDQSLLTALYREAVQEPNGPAAKALASYRVPLKAIDTDALVDGHTIKLYQEAVAKAADGDIPAGIAIANGSAAFSQKVREELFLAGTKPKDNMLPDAFLGELGEKVAIPGGGEMFLPKPIAQSFKETVAARDILKDTLGASPFGKASLKVLDHGTSFFKKMVTLPFPAYWGQNFLGDRFRQAMLGVHAYNPGIFARTKSVLDGKSAVVSKNGLRMDKPALERAIREMGMSYSVNDMLGTVQSFGDMNIDVLLAEKGNSTLKNVFNTKKGTWIAALNQTHDKFQKSFDGFFRVSHFLHRFEQGDTVADAARAAQDAYFNYRDMSPVESSLFRRFYMFYGYMSKATKTTMTDLVTNPGNITMQLHGTRALGGMLAGPEGPPTLEQHELKLLNSSVNAEQLSKVIGRAPDGTLVTARGFAAPLNAVMQQYALQTPRNFSVGELIDTFTDSAGRTIQKQFAMSNPAINAAAQMISGKNLYFDKPLSADFLRKMPDLTAAAEVVAGFTHTDLPVTLNDTVKTFLKAVPDGKGRLIADQSRFWILTNLIPGMGRAMGTLGGFTNTDIPEGRGLTRALTGINISDQDPSRTYLYQRKAELEDAIQANSVNQRLKNQRAELLGLDDEE